MRSTRSTIAGRLGRALILSVAFATTLGVLAVPAGAAFRFADVTVQKTATASSIEAGDTAGFTITVSNVGDRDATGVTLSDVLPDSGLAWAENPDVGACTVTDSAGGDVLSCSVATLAAGASFSVTVEAATNPESCDYGLNNTATVAADNESARKTGNNTASASISVTCPPPPPPGGCTFTQGFWKTHPEAWPVSSLSLGTVSYTSDELEAIFNAPVAGNGLISLAHQLIAAKLNIASGADPSAISQAITDADAMIDGLVVPPVGSGSLAPGDTSDLVDALTAFNEGATGPGHCDEEE
jgi:uncharacterized repeat protein (TIGR01451 family)